MNPIQRQQGRLKGCQKTQLDSKEFTPAGAKIARTWLSYSASRIWTHGEAQLNSCRICRHLLSSRAAGTEREAGMVISEDLPFPWGFPHPHLRMLQMAQLVIQGGRWG